MQRYDFLNVTGSDSVYKKKKSIMNSFMYKYKGLDKGYINYCFISFSDLGRSFWFELK